MDKRLKFSSQELLDVKFNNCPQGYDPLEVDKVLDSIIEDYERLESEVSNSNIDAGKLAKEVEELKAINQQLRLDLESEKNKWQYVSKDHKNIHIDNYELLQRIGRLEMYIKEHLNVNPDEIK